MIKHVKDNIIITQGITKSLDKEWFPGSGQGGLDEGEIEPNTWYHFYIIKKSMWNRFKTYIKNIFKRQDENIYDILISKDAKEPYVPSGYKKKKRIPGSIITDEKANIITFFQINGFPCFSPSNSSK